ncbi:MAG: heparinase II/III family protein [Bacteroidota bacterium]
MYKLFTTIAILLLLGACAEPSEPATDTLFAQELARTQVRINALLESGVNVPVPKDMAGGYTHEEHKRNWSTLRDAGALYRFTGEEKYAVFVRDVLFEYAALYPTLPKHPTDRSYATGKLFWQCLNDANWLVYVSQGYADVYDWLEPEVREKLNRELFRPMADFLSVENPQYFNRIHNHSTWGCAAVGMIGLVMNDDELVERALHGLSPDLIPADLRDDDTGLIKDKYGRAGFLAQLDLSFSPDGYFTEGPYYLRYALSPFLLFGRALAEKRPELNILEYRDGILGKAIDALVLQAAPNGDFFPINDSQKGMSVYSPEVVKSVDYGYHLYGQNPELLSLAIEQDAVTLDEAGKAVSDAIAAGKSKPFQPASSLFTDGADGTEGGVAILRAFGDEGQATSLLLKYAAQGMGHGHFDRLGYSFYNDTGEVIQDYGSARWVNIDQKGGGRYLKENNSWAKQSVAHNTVVVDKTSHYNGDIRLAENHHPELYVAELDDPNIQLVSAKETNAYSGRELHRSQWFIHDEAFAAPLLVDILRSAGTQPALHDLPTWYQGQLLQTNFAYATNADLNPLGKDHGYQHLWSEASGTAEGPTFQLNWLNNGRFHTLTTVAAEGDELHFVRLGANDPEFNLRRDPAFLLRRKATASTTFVSVLETHGSYTPRDEVPHQPFGEVTNLELLVDEPAYTVIAFRHANGTQWKLFLANQNQDPKAEHTLELADQVITWIGTNHLTKNHASK